MALAEGAAVDIQTAGNIIRAAVQTSWDREFTSNDKIKTWLVEQVQRVPFDPAKIKLLDYVKSRMKAAESQQKQQQQQQQPHPPPPPPSQPPQQQDPTQFQTQSAPTSAPKQQQQPTAQIPSRSAPASYTTQQANSASNNGTTAAAGPRTTSSNGKTPTSSYTVISDDDSSGQESDDGQYQFGFEDMVDPEAGRETGLLASRSPSPLPPPSSQNFTQQGQQQSAIPTSFSSSSQLFPFAAANGQSNRPFSSASGASNSGSKGLLPLTSGSLSASTSHSMALNPALLLNNNGNPSGTISPHQLGNSTALPVFQANPVSYASPSLNKSPIASTSSAPAPAPASKTKRRQEVEVVVTSRRESSPGSAAKGKRMSSSEVNGVEPRQPLSATTTASAQQKQKQKEKLDSPLLTNGNSTSSSAPSSSTSTTQPTSILSITKNTPKPPSKSTQCWLDKKKEILRSLQQANRTPHKTVTNLFRSLDAFVSEPEGATSRPGSREAFVTDLKVPTEARLAILDIIRDETNNDFDVIFVVDPRATVLLHEWTRDLAYIAKGKYVGEEDQELIKTTARPLMEVLRKLPISLDVLRALKGVGGDVRIISKSDDFDEEAKNIAGMLVRRWVALTQRVDGGSARAPSATPTPQPAPANNKRPGLAPQSGDGAEDDTRKKRKVSPTLSVSSETSRSAKPSTSTKTSTPAPSTGPKGTQPLGRLPSQLKPATVTPASGGRVLPSFAKRKPVGIAAPKAAARPAATPASAPAAATAPAFDPFAMSLQDMAASKESAAGAGMSVGDTLSMLHKAVDNASILNSSHAVPRAGQQKKKSVRWQEDDKLVLIKWVDKLVYGDEYGNEITTSEYFNTTGETAGESEGAAMHGLVEQMEWEEPEEVDVKLPEDMVAIKVGYPHPELMGEETCERDRQAEREKGVLAVTYFTPEEIPFSPGEDALLSDDQMRTLGEPITMLLSQALAGDQSIQLAMLRAQTSLYAGQQSGTGAAQLSYPAGHDAMPAGPPSLSVNPQLSMYGGPPPPPPPQQQQQHQQMQPHAPQQSLFPHQQPLPSYSAAPPPSAAAGAAPGLEGANLSALLAQLSGGLGPGAPGGPGGGGVGFPGGGNPPYQQHQPVPGGLGMPPPQQHHHHHPQQQSHYQPNPQYPQHFQQY